MPAPTWKQCWQKKKKAFCYRFVMVSTVGTLCVEISLHWSFVILILLLYPAGLDFLKPQSNHKDLKCTFCTLYPAILCIVVFFNSWTCFLIAAGPHSVLYVFGHACILAFVRTLCTLHPFQYTLIFVYDMTHICYLYINELTEYSHACFHTRITVFVCALLSFNRLPQRLILLF